MPKLTLTLPDGTEQSHDLIDDQVSIGRAPDNGIELLDASVSSHHATLTLAENDYVFRDIGSTNGSRVNGKDITANTDHRLQDGDSFHIGKILAHYASETPAEARPMPEEDTHTLAPAASSAAPVNFQNASPFQSKQKKKDPAGKAIMALAIVSILIFLGALVQVASLQAPN